MSSELIRHLAFRDKPGTPTLSDVFARISLLAQSVPVDELWNSLHLDVDRVFSDGRGRNQVKRDVWIKYDQLMSPSSKENCIALVDELLARCY